jgi:NodT family efflux transporter outer membrane factor (OMF) lipoprotein
MLICGCTTLQDYVHNGFKVGPNYGQPPVSVAKDWIDASDQRVRKDPDDISRWWAVFNDPVLNSLIDSAYRQNLTLRQAGFRVLQARAQLGIAVGELFPQTQTATGDFTRNALSGETALDKLLLASAPGAGRFYDQWDFGFNLGWELDFWGRFRRAVEANQASLNASVENYDDVLVTLLSDIASNYTQLRTFQERLQVARDNVKLQQETLGIVEARFKAGTTTALDVAQARSTLEQTQALIPDLEISIRQANNQLCILLGIPPEQLQVGSAPIPIAPTSVAVGIPADLLRRRPDVRRAERQAAAQCAQIGIADADFYPRIAINGNIGYAAEFFPDVFRSSALEGSVGPTFQWNILNYGRILNNVRAQRAHFQELVAAYQETVLSANRDVENGLVTFLRSQERTRFQAASVTDAEKAVEIAIKQYKAGTIDLTRVTQIEQALVVQQDTLAQARGEIALGLIQTYRALGGGWEIRCSTQPTAPAIPTVGTPLPCPPYCPGPDDYCPKALPAVCPCPAPSPEVVPSAAVGSPVSPPPATK